LNADGRARVEAMLGEVRPALHRYCARLTGSVFDGEDVVQDVVVRALAAADGLDADVPLRPWLFRIAHNRALDHLRRQAVRRGEPIEAALDVAGEDDPDEALLRREAVDTAVSRFVRVPVVQRSAVILKDVLGHSLQEIADLLDLSVDAVKAVLSRGRAKLRAINAAPPEPRVARAASAEGARFAALFNGRDWDALRALLAEDVRLVQATHPERNGSRDVGHFFTIYAGIPEVRLAPAHLADGSEVIAVFTHHPAQAAYFMRIDWRGGEIAAIRDYRYAGYILEGAGLVLAE